MRDRFRSISTQAAFDRLAEGWDAAHGPASPRASQVEDRIAYLRTFCMHEKPARVLEIGCGTGQNLLGIADLLTVGVGVDVSSAMVAQAARNAEEAKNRGPAPLRFITGDALTLSPRGLGSFDAVLFIGALEHIEPPVAALAVARALLTPAGRVVVIMPHPWQPRMLLNPRPRVDGRPIATRMLTPRRLQQVAREAHLSMTGLAVLSALGRPWRSLPPNRLGNLLAATGCAYTAELAQKRPLDV